MAVPFHPQSSSTVKVTLAVSVAALLVCALAAPFFQEQGTLQFGLLLCWTGLCVAAVLADRMLLWAVLCLAPLALISLCYWADRGMTKDPFGMRLALTQAFLIASLITAGTGALSIVRTAAAART